MSWKKRFRSLEWQAFGLILAAAASVMLPALRSYFTFDDLMNLAYYANRPGEALYSNLILFTSFRRPLGALFYLPSYHLFGMNPLPLYIAGLALVTLNLALIYTLVLRLTRSLAVAVGSTSVVALHPHMHVVLFNFGSVYEQTAMTGILAGLHCYLSLLSRPPGSRERRRLYAATLLCYWMALNAKETAVVLPAILLAYEIFYRIIWSNRPTRLAEVAKRLVPLFLVAVPYTLAKVFGEEAYWRSNPLYVYHWDLTPLRNLTEYAGLYTYDNLHFNTGSLLAVLAGLAVAGLLLRNRHVLFGLTMTLLTFLPVLPLPRVWALFLYLPSAGLALCLVSLTIDLSTRLAGWILPNRLLQWRPGHIVQLILVIAFVGTALEKTARSFRIARQGETQARIAPWGSFARQLYEMFPELPYDSALGFENPPFDPDNHEQWCPHFLVELGYWKQNVHVYRLPQQLDLFRRAATAKRAAYWLTWDEGELKKKDFALGSLDGPSPNQP